MPPIGGYLAPKMHLTPLPENEKIILMSQKTYLTGKKAPCSPRLEPPKAVLITDRQQAHPHKCTRTGERVDGQMRHGERPDKGPAYNNSRRADGNRQQATGNRQQATGNYTHLLTNNVNKLIVYITSLFSSFFKSDSFYSHYFGKTSSVIFDSDFLYKTILRSIV